MDAYDAFEKLEVTCCCAQCAKVFTIKVPIQQYEALKRTKSALCNGCYQISRAEAAKLPQGRRLILLG